MRRVVGGGYWIAVPVIRAEAAAHSGDDNLRAGKYESASGDYVRAAHILPMNADYAFRAGRCCTARWGRRSR